MTVVNFLRLDENSGLLLCDERVTGFLGRLYDVARKIFYVKDGCYMGISGNPTDCNEVLRLTKDKIDRFNITSNREMEEVIREAYTEAKNKALKDRLLSPYNLTWEDVSTRSLPDNLRNYIMDRIQRPPENVWSASIVVGGFVDNGPFSIYHINYPGTIDQSDYYGTTGSGGDRADIIFGDGIQEIEPTGPERERTIPLGRGVRLIFDATRSGMRNRGVGGRGQLFYISKNFEHDVEIGPVRSYEIPEIRLFYNVLYLERKGILTEYDVDRVIGEVVEENMKAAEIISKLRRNIGDEKFSDEFFNNLHI